MMHMIKNIKLNKFNQKLLGAAIFLNAEYVEPFVKSTQETHISVEIETTKDGIMIRPIEGLIINRAGRK